MLPLQTVFLQSRFLSCASARSKGMHLTGDLTNALQKDVIQWFSLGWFCPPMGIQAMYGDITGGYRVGTNDI